MHCKNSILQRIIVNKRYDVMKCKIYGWLLNCFEQYISIIIIIISLSRPTPPHKAGKAANKNLSNASHDHTTESVI